MKTYTVWSMGRVVGKVVMDWRRPPFKYACYFFKSNCYVQ